MSYTSPSPALVSANGQQVTWWVSATNYGPNPGTSVVVQVQAAPIGGLSIVTFTPPAGTSFNPTTGLWSVGTLASGQTKWLRIVTSVADIGLAPYTLTSTISGNGIDPNNVNNVNVQTLESTVCDPSAGAVDDPNSCCCVDVSLNDTPCTHGTTTYVLDELSVQNSTTYVWDINTGRGHFQHDNPTESITFEYSIWCDVGSGPLETSGPAVVTIPALFPLSGLNLSLSVNEDTETLDLLFGTTVISSVPLCDIVNTCTVITNNDLTA